MAEQIGEVKALIARARADLLVQEARVEQVRRQLQADVLEPARAKMEAGIAEAKGNASKITEDGKATVTVLQEMIATWKQSPDNARDIFLMQKLQSMMDALVETITDVKIDQVTVLPTGDNSTAKRAVTLVEELKAGTGIDIPKVVDRVTGGQASDDA